MRDRKAGKIALICNGAVDDHRWLARELEGRDVLIAVDGGADHLRRAGLRPDLVVGDMDSIVEPFGPDVPVRPYPERKDASDMELAVRHALAIEHSTIDVYGALGGREDHQFCNIMVLTNYQAAITIRAGNTSIRCVHENTAAELRRKGEADIVTIMPVDETAVVTTTGLEYGLDGEALARGSRGLSNVIKGERAVVRVESGKVLLFHSW